MTKLSRWMDDLQFYGPFKCVPVISNRLKVDNERLWGPEPCTKLERILLQHDSNLADQC